MPEDASTRPVATLSDLEAQLERSRSEARTALDEALAARFAAKEARENAVKDLQSAERRRQAASKLFQKSDAALRAIRGERQVPTTGARRDVYDMLFVCEYAIRQSAAGLDKAALAQAIKENIDGSQRGLHKTIARLFEALHEDPRFVFDGNVYTMKQSSPQSP